MINRKWSKTASTVLTALLISGPGQIATAQDDVAALKKIVVLQESKLNSMKDLVWPVGAVMQSFLSVTDFQAQMGPEWVLCDGTSYPDSEWESINTTATNPDEVPDCTGRFLRSAGGNAALLGSSQEDATDVNQLAALFDRANFGSHTHGDGSYSVSLNHDHANTTATTSNDTHDHEQRIAASGSGGVLRLDHTSDGPSNILAQSGVRTFTDTHNHSVTINTPAYTGSKDITGTSASASFSGNQAVSLSSGDDETRPTNVTVNTFIKINKATEQ